LYIYNTVVNKEKKQMNALKYGICIIETKKRIEALIWTPQYERNS